MSCAICHQRKEKRFCLALHDRICPQCCGEQRERTLDCPSECPYLQQARQHEKPRDLGEKLPEELFPAITLSQEFLHRHEALIAGLLQTLLRVTHSDRNVRDRELIAGLHNMARSYQTLVASGLLYQDRSANPAELVIMEVLQRSLDEYRRVEQQHLGYAVLKDNAVLKALVFMIRLAYIHNSGRPLSRGFVDFLQARFSESQSSPGKSPETGSRIIMP